VLLVGKPFRVLYGFGGSLRELGSDLRLLLLFEQPFLFGKLSLLLLFLLESRSLLLRQFDLLFSLLRGFQSFLQFICVLPLVASIEVVDMIKEGLPQGCWGLHSLLHDGLGMSLLAFVLLFVGSKIFTSQLGCVFCHLVVILLRLCFPCLRAGVDD